ncbi:MAG: TIGR03790 family protein [Pirellulaceae bacterium]
MSNLKSRITQNQLRKFLFAIMTTLAWTIAGIANAQLTPESVAVLACKGNAESEALAQHYLEKRGIPEQNLLLLEFDNEEMTSRADWQDRIRPAILKWLNEAERQNSIRCIVTLRGVPLVVDKQFNEQPDAFRAFLEHELKMRSAKAEETLKNLRALANGEAPADSANNNKVFEKSSFEWNMEFEQVATDCQKRLNDMPQSQRTKYAKQFETDVTILAGSNLLFKSLESQVRAGNANESVTADFHLIRGRLVTLQETLSLLGQVPSSPELDTVTLAVIERANGILGTIGWLDAQLNQVRKNETHAAFDSELALVRWPMGVDRLHRWQPNLLRSSYSDLYFARDYPMLMVARIDAGSWETCKRMIDDAIEAESAGGLTGKAYLDGRGIPSTAEDSIEKQYDMDLLATNRILNGVTSDVVTNTSPKVFAEGECPEAAIYCGAFSLGKYVDAFDWSRGAIGYHLSTMEALGLHDPASSTWCRSILEDGAVATIGALDESGLAAIPRPTAFFEELVTKHKTLGEAFWAAQPVAGWHVMLLGDPLYCPFPKASE